MWSPGLTLSTSSLFSRTIPAASWPSTIGGGQSPFMMCQSLMQTPAALARTRTLLGFRRLLLEIKDLQGFVDFGQNRGAHVVLPRPEPVLATGRRDSSACDGRCVNSGRSRGQWLEF